MLFNSFEFLVFFPIVVICYHILPSKLKNIWLLITSYYFYMSWNVKYGLLIFLVTVVSYCAGMLLERCSKPIENYHQTAKKTVLLVTCLFVFGILFFFKYWNYSSLLAEKIFLALSLDISIPRFDILLPVGISFYTFQSVGYVVDVFRGNVKAEKNFIQYALFVSFFPQLVAGPIERSGNLLSQLQTPSKVEYDSIRKGLLLMIWGFFLKIVVADRIAVFVDTVFSDIDQYRGVYLVIASVFFAFQIYCDFMGYSIIAIGAAQIIGISLTNNFDAPYLALNVGNFWRRWHISLWSWLRDYVYIPLGGNRRGKARKYFNVMVTFIVSGIWHGAGLNYLAWGGWNGLFIIIGDICKPARDRFVNIFKLNRNSFGHKVLSILVTFILVDFTWIFFRTSNMTQAVQVVNSIFTDHNWQILFNGGLYKCGLSVYNFWLAIIAIAFIIATDCCRNRNINLMTIYLNQDSWFRCVLLSFFICTILLFGKWGGEYDASKFIYFQF